MRKFLLLNILITSFVFLSAAVIQSANGEVKLRTTYKSLYKADQEGLKNLLIGKFSENQKDGRIIDHNYKLKTIDGGKVVIDNFTGLMWHQSGSTGFGITWQKAEEWVEKLNRERICRISQLEIADSGRGRFFAETRQGG